MNSSTNIPGYSGHIPYKSGLIGLTNGAGNRAAEVTYRSTQGKFNHIGASVMDSTQKMPSYQGKSKAEKSEATVMVGNHSRYS